MKLNPQGFRTFVGVDCSAYMRTDTASPLILVKKNGEMSFAKNRGEKDALVASKKTGDVLLYAWAGQYSTDVFVVSDEDLAKHYDPK